jgi:hypothetical protein
VPSLTDGMEERAVLDSGVADYGAGRETLVTFSVLAGSKTLNVTADGKYDEAPRLTRVTVLGVDGYNGERVIELDRLDLAKGGTVKW